MQQNTSAASGVLASFGAPGVVVSHANPASSGWHAAPSLPATLTFFSPLLFSFFLFFSFFLLPFSFSSFLPLLPSLSCSPDVRTVYDIVRGASDAPFLLSADGRRPLTHGAARAFILDGVRLAQHGLGKAARVVFAVPNGPEAALGFLALSVRCTLAPLNLKLAASDIAFELEDLPADAVIVGANAKGCKKLVECARHASVPVLVLVPDAVTAGVFTLEPLPHTPAKASGGGGGGGGGGEGAQAAAADGRRGGGAPAEESWHGLDEVCLVLHTSGTTLKPKLVPLTHRNLCAAATSIASTLHLKASDVALNVMPLYHLHGIMVNLLVPAISGGAVVCSAGWSDAAAFFGLAARGGATWYSAVPTMHLAITQHAERSLMRVGAYPKHSLAFARNCSAALASSLAERMERALGLVVVPSYAMSECVPICSNPRHGLRKLGSVGPPAGPSVKILVAGATGDELTSAAGVHGEVCVKGTCCTSGYEWRPHMSQGFSAFAEGGYLKTGDKGYFDSDGYLFLSGRLKELINRAAEKISPLVIENEVAKDPRVGECLVFACPHTELGEVVGVAVVVAERDAGGGAAAVAAAEDAFTLASLRQFLAIAAVLESKWLPECLVFVPSTPRGPTGKPLRIGFAERLGIPQLSHSEASRSGGGGGRIRQTLRAIPTQIGIEEHEAGGAGTVARDLTVGVAAGALPAGAGVATAATEAAATAGRAGKTTVVWKLEDITPLGDASSGGGGGGGGGGGANVVGDGDGDGDGDGSDAGGTVGRVLSIALGVMGMADLGNNTVLIDAGLDSMTSVLLVDQLSDTFEVDLPSDVLDTYGTVNALAARIEALQEYLQKPNERYGLKCEYQVGWSAEAEEGAAAAAADESSGGGGGGGGDAAARAPAKETKKKEGGGKKKKSAADFEARKEARRLGFGQAKGKTRARENASTAGTGLHAAKEGLLDSLKAKVETEGWEPQAVVDRHGLTALQWAAGGGHLQTVKYLLSDCKCAVDQPNKEGRTPLMWACRNGHLEVALLLAEHGAEIGAVTKKGVSSLHWATWGGSVPVVAWLLEQGLDIETLSNAGCNCAVWAAAAGRLPMCQWLWKKGANFDRVNFWGHGVVSKASWHGHNEVLEWLFQVVGCTSQMFIINHVGEIPVELAQQAGHGATVELMYKYMAVNPSPFQSFGGDPTVHQHKVMKIDAAAAANPARFDDM